MTRKVGWSRRVPDEVTTFDVRLTRQALKDLRKLRSQAGIVAEALDRLQTDPSAGHMLRGTLAGVRSLEFTLKGGGAGRAAYVVMPEHKVCLVFIIGPHEGFYERAERRAAGLDALSGEPHS